MHKLLRPLLMLMLLASCSGFANEKPHVLVSVAPHKFLVERIAGDTVTVGVLVPAEADLHTYEPTPRQVMAASNAVLWFRFGEAFEDKVVRSLTAHNAGLQLVDLRDGLNLTSGTSHCHHGCCHGGVDLHIWLSPRLMLTQARTVERALSKRFPQHQQRYRQALEEHLAELAQLDGDISKLLGPHRGEYILLAHPAFGYFCRDYAIHQMAIEFEGKDPSPRQLTQMLQKARARKIATVFTQLQFNNKAAILVAEQLGARVVLLDPFEENYLRNLWHIAQQFAQAQ